MGALVSFRTLQAISDLQALAEGVLDNSLSVVPLSGSGREALRGLVKTERCMFDSDASLKLWPVLNKLSEDAAQPEAVCALANGILAANALQGGDRKEVAGSLWSASVHRLRQLPPRLRGPLARAAGRTADLHRFPDRAVPTGDDKVSVDLAGISERLVKIGQAVTEEEIQHIARADYGCDRDRHLSALRQVIFNQDCVFTDAQGWYPSEVVELVSHVPTEPAFAVATAILLNHCIHKGDLQGSTDFRWENNAAAYLALPPELRGPILAGFRAIYESDDNWSPYYSALFDSAENRAVLLPQPLPELTRM